MDPSGKSADAPAAFGTLLNLIRTLRSENGCPWDRKQTPLTLHHYILEEYHEMVQALNEGDKEAIIDEMGDLMFLVIFVAYVFEQEHVTTIGEIIDRVVEKMTRRHPHVFGTAHVTDADQVIDNWGRIKASEEIIRQRGSLLDGIPRSLPALSRAQKLSGRAAKVGFDWTRAEDVFAKVDEELGELKEAVHANDLRQVREELGDLLFVVTNAARHLQVNSEVALNETSDKFERSFRHIETSLRERGKSPQEVDLAEMDRLWDEAKELEKTKNKKESG